MRTITRAGMTPDYHAASYTKLVSMGSRVETTTLLKPPRAPPVQRIDKDHWMDLRTGEVFDIIHATTRADDYKSIRRTLARIRALINTNVTEARSWRWVTLTYADNMCDTRQLYQDFRRFWQRFVYWCEGQGYPAPEYITVQEPQGRGAWHVHAFFGWPGLDALFVDNNSVLWPTWGHGFTKITALSDIDNIGAYFSAYLGDMPLDEVRALSGAERTACLTAGQTVDKMVSTSSDQPKKFVKGARLPLYPAGMRIVRYSQGIKKPTTEVVSLEEALDRVGAATLTYTQTYEIKDDDKSINTLTKSYYTL